MSIEKKVIFIGSKQLGLETLKVIYSIAPQAIEAIITYNDEQDSRSVLPLITKFGKKNLKPTTVVSNKKDFESTIDSLQFDIAIVVGWYWMISKKVLNKKNTLYLGLHNSLLPKYRGGAPLIWAILNREEQTGVSLFEINDKMDEGNVWGQEVIRLKKEDYISDVLEKLHKASKNLFSKVYSGILSSNITPTPQSHEMATYGGLRFPEDSQINWNEDAEKVYDLIRSVSHPYPGAYTIWNKKKLYIWKATPLNNVYYGIPGQVLEVLNNKVLISCGKNTCIQIEIISYKDFHGSADQLIKSIKIRF